jgi:undecaprenyl-diphosphatase
VVQHRAGWLNPLFEALSWLGTQGFVWVLIALGIALVRRRPELFARVVIADGVAQILAYGLKQGIGRDRPSAVYEKPGPLVGAPHDGSFPSGHAASSFACATTLALALPRFAWAFYLLAAAVAWSRVYVGVHYPLDVLGGAILGIGVAIALRRLLAALLRSRRARPRG